MKIVFTEEEAKELIIIHVKRLYGVYLDRVEFNHYMEDFCVVSESAELRKNVDSVIEILEEKFGGTA